MTVYNINSEVTKIAQLCSWLTGLIEKAEDHFLQTAVAEYDLVGVVSDNPREAADDLCSGAQETANAILRHLAIMCGATHVPLDWSTREDALWQARVQSAVSAITSITQRVAALASSPDDPTLREPLASALNNIYDQAVLLLNSLGPRFATPFTALTPVTTAVKINAEVEPYALDTLILTLDGCNWPAGAGWHQLAAGDLVYIATLDVTGFEEAVGQFAEVATVSGTEVLVLTLTTPFAADVVATDSLEATEPGTVWMLRKISNP